MNTLRQTILNSLSRSSEKNPVPLDTLVKETLSLCENPDALADALNALVIDQVISMARGYRECQKYQNYWLTGTISELPAAKMQPKTSIHEPKPKEQNMNAEQKSNAAALPAIVREVISKQPGISHNDLMTAVARASKNTPVEQIEKCVSNQLHASKKIRSEGNKGKGRIYFLTDPEQAAAPAKAKPAKGPFNVTRTVKAKPKPVNGNGRRYRFAFDFADDGSVAIHKDEQSIELSAAEFSMLTAA